MNFFSIQTSTDASKKEYELFMAQYLESKATYGPLHIWGRFLAVDSGTGEGVHKML